MTVGGFPHSEILGSKPCWRLPEAYRSLKRPSSVLSAKASTIRPCRAAHTTKMAARFLSNSQTTNHHTVKNDHKTIETNTRVQIRNQQANDEKTLVLLASTIQFSNHHAPPPDARAPATADGPRHDGHPKPRHPKRLGWRSGSPKAHPYTPHPAGRQGKPTTISSTPARPPPSTMRRAGRTPSDEHPTEFSVERR